MRIPSQPSHSPSKASPGLRALLRFDYLLLISWAVLSALGYVVLLFSLPSYGVAIGLTQEQGSLAGALLNLGQAIGRPAVGFLSDSFGRFEVAIVASFMAGLLSLVLWIFANSAGLLYFFAIAVGLFSGTYLAAMAPLAAEVVGLQSLGAALGVMFFILSAPMTVAEAIALELRDDVDNSKPYLRAQLFTGFIYVGSAAVLSALWVLLRVQKKK